ncbi:signal peptidase I [Dasania sp. GY-MA-18]|uniref:Signal peptidase I n=2 Tax=Spongiibacteraceae TaxID=1706375 RepID=A0A9J6RP00_9GAMM|nr:signal peptidase I [Dasania sp. GY-MA-18]MCZ0865741.1 signal peptidase I [Dasania phycosphaerae]MCZ0869466.1 signal peptidase I [Dasania phycosphaerae]
MWLAWGASIFLVKDGDFALVLVWLTLFSGLVYAIDHFFFADKRNSYVESPSVTAFLGRYVAEQKELLLSNYGRELILAEYAKSFFPVLFVVVILRSFIVEPFQIPSASMVPTLKVGDYILVNKYTYGLRLPVLGTKILEVNEPQRGDVMVFFPPDDPRYFIKRVIGLPGDEIIYSNKTLTINGEPMAQEFVAQIYEAGQPVKRYKEQFAGSTHTIHQSIGIDRGGFSIVVPQGHYFMMGDNRDNSSDSRFWGPVPEQNIVGKAFAKWMYWPSITQLPSFSRAGMIE